MNEMEIRKKVESKQHRLDVIEKWLTPAGNQRKAPMYETHIENRYLDQYKVVKATSIPELRKKTNAALSRWNETEIRKRVIEAKKDSKDQARSEAERLNIEAELEQKELHAILKSTLKVDDKIDWSQEMDKNTYEPFSFRPPPAMPSPLLPPPKPSWAWLFWWQGPRWEANCAQISTDNKSDWVAWDLSVKEHASARASLLQKYETNKVEYLKKQEKFNLAVTEFRASFEAGDVESIIEYSSRVLERADYPDSINLKNTIDFDSETGFVVVDIDVPSPDALPQTAGYKFVATGNKIVPIILKKKAADALYKSVVDQIIVRTVHEILEGCYIEKVQGVLLNAWVVKLNKASGNDERKRLCSLIADRKTFESFNLDRVEPAECIKKLSEGTGQMYGVSK